MPLLSFPGHPTDGPLIEVLVSPSAPYQSALISPGQVCPSFTATFLIDTGASHCLIDEDLVNRLGVAAKTPKFVLSAGAPKVIGYEVDLSLLLFAGVPAQGWLHGAVSVTTVPPNRFAGTKFQGLVGRDLLDQCELNYNGPLKQVQLSW